ncbi:MAG: hypothetical protein EPN86_05915 [Nanoarchaeota archaeon]|nr:MAG: hypothetical protein EPN86_05915 [Nanoarchaeota archaeon]
MVDEFLGDGAVRHVDGDSGLESAIQNSNFPNLNALLPKESRDVLAQDSYLTETATNKALAGFAAFFGSIGMSILTPLMIVYGNSLHKDVEGSIIIGGLGGIGVILGGLMTHQYSNECGQIVQQRKDLRNSEAYQTAITQRENLRAQLALYNAVL